MALNPGSRIGVYRIGDRIGAGGMGQVYRATDTNLGRDVAIKVLLDDVARDEARIARLEREARTLASLNHRNIAIVHGFERGDGVDAIVMELIEGPTLAERIARGPFRLDEALSIASGIAEALEAAHDQGILHRDLKPANIKIASDGSIKVLDFGLAKIETRPGNGRHQDVTATATMPGTILGTASYMSPEQASGAPVDRSSDVWAFGCVLYEMLTGRTAFDGPTNSDILAAVLKTEPDWSRLPASTPEAIVRLLRRCLRKAPRARLRDIRDARIEIAEAVTSDSSPSANRDRTVVPGRWVWVLAAAVTAAGITWAFARARPAQTPSPETRFEFNTPALRSSALAVAPDGRSVVFSAIEAGQTRLWLRSFDSLLATALPGTEDGTLPFWSPTGRSIGFFAESQLRRLDLDTGLVKTLLPALLPLGADWNRDDVIILATRPGSPVVRVSAEGGVAAAVTMFERQHRAYSNPHFLPDGRHFVFFVSGPPDARGIYLGQLDDPQTRRLLISDGGAVYVKDHLVFLRDGALLAQGFDPQRLEMVREPYAITSDVNVLTSLSAAGGTIAYRPPPTDTGQRQLLWVDRAGTEIEKVIYDDVSSLGPSLSPDARRIALFRFANGNMDLWWYERNRRLWERLTVDARDDIFPLWLPDGAHLVFAASRSQTLDLFTKRVGSRAGSGEELLHSSPEPKWPMDISADGRQLLYTSINPETGPDLWVLPLTGDRTPREVLKTPFAEQLPQFFPGGRLIAYQSNQTGRNEIFVRPLEASATEIRISTEGGGQPRWGKSGHELFYVAPDDWLMSVAIRAKGDAIEPGPPVRLFKTIIGSTAINTSRHQYAVSPDGSFVLNSSVPSASVPPVKVILNWAPRRP